MYLSQATLVKGIAKELKAGLTSEEATQLDRNMDHWLGDHSNSVKVGYINMFGAMSPVYMSLDLFYAYHVMIAGTTRTGKTTSIKTVIYLTNKESHGLIKKFTFFDVENQFSQFEKYGNTKIYNFQRMSWTERFNIIIREVRRIMARNEGEGDKEVFVFDEFQNFVYEIGLASHGLNNKEKKLKLQCKEEIIKFMEQCLKRNASAIMMSPTITRTAKQAMDMCGTKILFQLENTDAVSKLAETIPKRYYKRILSFKPGYCIIVGKALDKRDAIFCRFRQIEKLKTYSMV